MFGTEKYISLRYQKLHFWTPATIMRGIAWHTIVTQVYFDKGICFSCYTIPATRDDSGDRCVQATQEKIKMHFGFETQR